jgi:DNA (cytosine-5)-methyltransferase 1
MRPTLLDLFCGAGGAATGYHRAGFNVVGVDSEPQPHYPYEFIQADALRFPLDGFDVIHASPPCHDYSTATGRNRKAAAMKGTAWMLPATIARLAVLDRPWVVENVETATFPSSAYRLRLCGSSFGLDLRRHRWFATNIAMLAPPCAHYWQTPRFRSLDGSRPRGYLAAVVGVHGHVNYAGEAELRNTAMGIDWMTQRELAQAIPPAYTEYIGGYLMAAINKTGGKMSRVLVANLTRGDTIEAELVLVEPGDEPGKIRLVLDNGDRVELDAVELAAASAGLHDLD